MDLSNRNMNGHILPSAYKERLDRFKKSDAEREDMLEEIIRNYESLKQEYEEKCDDYNNEVESRRLWQNKAREGARALTEFKQASGSNNFALCILDGDGALFTDDLYALGGDGGAEAAHQLYTALRNHLISTYPESNVSDWAIVIQVILNAQGLGYKLSACNIISNPSELMAFGRSFGLAQPLFSFIDVGGGKERADHKVRETLRLFLPNAQCKHVYFGPCHDNGYLPVLEPYKRDPGIKARLTLIDTLPTEPGFTQLGLEHVRFPDIFRSQNLPSKPASVASPIPQRVFPSMNGSNSFSFPSVPRGSPSPAPSADSNASSSWATVGKNGAVPKTINIAPKKTAPRRFILVNVYDERLDRPVPEVDSKAYQRFTDRVRDHGKYCNSYHLNGKCDLGEYCNYNHGERLMPAEQLVLRHKARTLQCPNRYACRDLDCLFGHHCKFGKACYLDVCRFTDPHHIQDMEPAKRIFEDGTEEWVPAYLERIRS